MRLGFVGRRHRGTISAGFAAHAAAPTRRNWCCTCRRRANCRYAERGRRCTCTSVWRGGSCRHLRVPSRYVGFRVASNLFVKPSAEPDLFRLCRGGKTKNEIQRFTPAANRRDRGGFRSVVGIPPAGRAVRPQNLVHGPDEERNVLRRLFDERRLDSHVGSSWPSMRRRLRSRRNSTSAGPSSLRRALSAGC